VHRFLQWTHCTPSKKSKEKEKTMKKFLLSMIVLAVSCAACLTASAQSLTSNFPGGYQSRAQNAYGPSSTANSYLLSDSVSLTWDWSVGPNGAYTLPGANAVYDRDTKWFYLRYANKDGDIRYFGPLYSPDHNQHVTDYFPGATQYPASGHYTVNSYFLSDNVTLNWDGQLARSGAYVLNGIKVAYDRNYKRFYVYDGSNWFGPLY
jgi:hypothetical protein